MYDLDVCRAPLSGARQRMYDGPTRMLAKLWLWITLGVVVSWTGVAAAQPVISTTPATSHSFGAVRYNNTAPEHTAILNLEIANTGDADLVVDSIMKVGGDTGDFTVTGTFPATIAGGTSTSFTVTYDPADAGASMTTLRIASNDTATPMKDITVTGTGATGVISVDDPAFGTVSVTTTASKNVTISNIGTGTKGPLGITQATLMNNSAGWFKFNATGCVGSTTTCALALSVTTGTATVRKRPLCARR